MTKKRKIWLSILAVLVIGIVFAIFYFKDNTDTTVVEKEQIESISTSVDSMFNEMENIDFEEDTTLIE